MACDDGEENDFGTGSDEHLGRKSSSASAKNVKRISAFFPSIGLDDSLRYLIIVIKIHSSILLTTVLNVNANLNHTTDALCVCFFQLIPVVAFE